jgi:hypothetical protein
MIFNNRVRPCHPSLALRMTCPTGARKYYGSWLLKIIIAPACQANAATRGAMNCASTKSDTKWQ